MTENKYFKAYLLLLSFIAVFVIICSYSATFSGYNTLVDIFSIHFGVRRSEDLSNPPPHKTDMSSHEGGAQRYPFDAVCL